MTDIGHFTAAITVVIHVRNSSKEFQ